MSNDLDTIISTMRQQGRIIDQFAINEARAMLAHKGQTKRVTMQAIGNRIEFKPIGYRYEQGK